MCSDIAIRVKNVSKAYQIYDKPQDRLKQTLWRGHKQFYREFKALDDVSFEVKKGETVGIIGRNGSGKSTLLQIICGTLAPTSGVVQVNGRVAALLELGAGFNPDFTGKENVYMNASILGLSKEEIDAKYDDIVAFADIGDFIDQPVKTYSSGMYVRLAFAVIINVDADILVIDEALAVGDAFFTQKCMRYLRNFMETGTVLFVSHDTGAILSLCANSIYLKDGAIIVQGESKEIIKLYLEELYKVQQGDSVNTNSEVATTEIPELNGKHRRRDMRLDFINQTTLRNDIELFPFLSDASSFGKKGAEILSVKFFDEQENELKWVVGGEQVKLVIYCITNEFLLSPIVGFQIKDRLGQVVFADNTYTTYIDNPLSIKPSRSFNAIFEFYMPVLPVGDYSISPAIAAGTQEEHVQHHWVHDAVIFKVHTSSVCLGLVGLQMVNIKMNVL